MVCHIEEVADESQVIDKLGSLIQSIADTSIESSDIFHVGVSGGSLLQMLEKCLPQLSTSWDKWRIYFCDERVVPFDSADSTYGFYKKTFEGKIPIDDKFVPITLGLAASEAAVDYQRKLKENFGVVKIPKFDLLLLGMGPDGHTCSLFPGHPLASLADPDLWVAPITDSPKPPPSRITLTFPVINNARNCVFALYGKGKAPMVKRILKNKDDSLPATRVKPHSGNLYWIFDKEAGSEMHSSS